jgi:hypothetical protein
MAARQNHDVLVMGAIGGGGLLAYQFLYKPWKAAKELAAIGGASTLPTYAPASVLSTPVSVGPAPGGVQGSIVDPRQTPGGLVGQVMWKKNWTQAQAQARLDALRNALATAQGAIANLKANTANPNAAGIPAAQLAAQQNDAAAANAIAQQQAALAAGDQAAASLWAASAAAHQQDAREIRARILAAGQAVDNSGAIAAYESAIAGYKSDFFALTGAALT